MKRVFGIILIAVLISGDIVLGGSGSAFLDTPTFIMVAGLTAGFALVSYRRGMEHNTIVTNIRRYCVYSGWLVFVMGLISYFASIRDTIVYANLALCLISLLYGYLGSILIECIFMKEK